MRWLNTNVCGGIVGHRTCSGWRVAETATLWIESVYCSGTLSPRDSLVLSAIRSPVLDLCVPAQGF